MTNMLVVNGEELNQGLINLLVSVVGPSARGCNFAPVLETLIDEILYPDIEYPFIDGYQLLRNYGVLTEDQIEWIVTSMVADLVRLKLYVLHHFPNCNTSPGGYYCRSQVDEYGLITISTVAVGSDDEVLGHYDLEALQQREDERNFDYIPERLRL